MFHKNSSTITNQSIILRYIIIMSYLAIYPIAYFLPVEYGWENGFIENSQVGICSIGCLAAIFFAKHANINQIRWFWIMIIPFWLILVTRELSWGASFLPPKSVDSMTGGIYSSSILPYKPYIYPILKFIIAGILAIFILSKQYKTLARLWNNQGFPLFELLLVVIGAIISTAAEQHMHLSLPFASLFNAGQTQIIEELAEAGAYLSLFAGQYRVYKSLIK